MRDFLHALVQIRFVHTDFFVLSIIVVLLAYVRLRTSRMAALPYSNISLLKKLKLNEKDPRYRHGLNFLKWLRAVALLLAILALSGPQYIHKIHQKAVGKSDIFLVLDFSKSMFRENLVTRRGEVSRFEAMRQTVERFLSKRREDRIGVVGFARYPSLVCPLTKDYGWVRYALEGVDSSQSYTAIGSGIVYACDLFKKSKNPNKFIIVLTDGDNNTGVSIENASQLARRMDVRLYIVQIVAAEEAGSIRVSKNRMAQAVKITGGKFYRAIDGSGLENIYDEISSMEKAQENRVVKIPYEVFSWLLLPAVILLFIELGLSQTVLVKLP